MTESLEDLRKRLDRQFYGINRGRGVHVLRDEWPRISKALEESERKLESARSDIEMVHFLLDQERPGVRGALVLLRRLRCELGGEW